MTQHHMFAPLRRWMIDAGSPQKLVALLIVAVMMIIAAIALGGVQGPSRSGMTEIENSGHTVP